ncbi:MAG: DUF4411 family protein [Solirubrobacteraceae bacterium]|nr:DUF4411 family protein [Solirubrobacteraceae bacterium]
MRWTIDGSAVNRIAEESGNYNAAFAAMTDLVTDGELTFCTEVCDELERTAENEPGAVWANAIKGQRQHKGASMTTLAWVIRNVGRVSDPEARYDAMPYVVSQARQLHVDHNNLAVVTEDVLDKPTRRSLADVCDELHIPWMRVPDWMNARGVEWP